MKYKHYFLRRLITITCLLLVTQILIAQKWSYVTRSSIFLTLAQGGIPPSGKMGYNVWKDVETNKTDISYNIFLHYSTFKYYITLEEVSLRYYNFITSFVIGDSCARRNYTKVGLDLFAMPLAFLQKTWRKPVSDAVLNDFTPEGRLDLLLGVLPFHVEGYHTKDSIVVLLKNIPFVTPILQDKGSYAYLLANVIHFYALHGERRNIVIVLGYGGKNGDAYIFPKRTHFKKRLRYVKRAPVIDYVK